MNYVVMSSTSNNECVMHYHRLIKEYFIKIIDGI